MLSIPLVQLSAQQQVPSAVPQDSPCASQPRSLSELAASFDKGRAPSAKELAGVWVEIGSFDYGMQVADDEEIPPHFRSLNCTGIMRGKTFEFATTGTDYAYVMELHLVGSSGVWRERMEPNHKSSSVGFSLCSDGECSGRNGYRCRLTQRGTLACINRGGGNEFRKMKVADSQIFGVFRP